jgi:hypothetical protein
MKIRLAILTDRMIVHAWEYEMVRRVAALSSVEVVSLLFGTLGGGNDRRNMILDMFWKLDRRLFRTSPDAFEPKDLKTLLPGMTPRDVLSSAASVTDSGVDVVLSLCGAEGYEYLARSARFGLWSVGQSDGLRFRGGPPGFWELAEDSNVVGSTLDLYRGDSQPVAIVRSYSRVHRHSWSKGRSISLWKTCLYAARKLDELSRTGEEAFRQQVQRCENVPLLQSTPRREGPSLVRSGLFVVRQLWRIVAEWVSRRFFIDQWELAFATGDGHRTDFARFHRVTPPLDRFWADPHVVARDGKAYIFLEECYYAVGRGHISLMTLANGKMSAPVKVLERPYHLSYPFLMEHGGTLYMIPETRDNGTIELYTCVDFPLRWELCRTLMSDIRAVDSTIIRHAGKWWLFANVAQHEGVEMSEELFLFWTDEFPGGEWHAHTMNPIVSDVRYARPAGPVFMRGDRMIRPSQDSSLEYGGGLNFCEIMVLTETEYREVPLARFVPDWDKRINGMHTYCHEGCVTVIDLRVATPKGKKGTHV